MSGNVFIWAPTILGADNISAGGDIKGLPPAEDSASLALEGSDSNTAASDAARDATQNNVNQQPSIIIVEVLGFGGGDSSGGQDDEEERRRREGQQGYNPDAPVQILGRGTLSESQMSSLTPEEQQRKLQAGAQQGM